MILKLKNIVILCVVLINFSCNSTGQSKSTVVKQTENGVDDQVYKDPLFFIDGQLCQHLRKIFQDSKGNLWLGTNIYDLMLYDGDSLSYINEKDGFSSGRITGIIEDKHENIWIGTSNGLNKFDGKSFTIFNEYDGLQNREIWSLMIDSKDVLWIGHNQGLSRYDGQQFESISVPKENIEDAEIIYSGDRIVAVVEDSKGDLWIGTDGYGIYRYDGESFTSLTKNDGLADNTISELLVDSEDNLWIGTYWGGLSKFDGKTISNFTKEETISGKEISALFEDVNGDIWIGVEHYGAYKYTGESFIHFDQESFSNASILSIYRDRENRLWFGGWGGLFRQDQELLVPVTKDGPWK